MQSLGVALAAAAGIRPISSALIFEGVHYTYRIMAARAATVAGALGENGIRPGDHVAVALQNSPELVAAVLGVLHHGATLVPINPNGTTEEVKYVLENSGARAAILEQDLAAALAATRLPSNPVLLTAADTIHGTSGNLNPVDPDSPALIVYTSGTTGRPKGAVLSHRALQTNLKAVAEAWRWTDEDRLLLTLPCFHLHGLGLGILNTFLVGSCVALRERFVLEEVLGDVERTRATMFFGVPTIYNRLVTLPDDRRTAHDLSRVRLWVSGSAPLTAATFERFAERFGVALMNRYGMTECAFALSTPYDEPRRAGVVGRALPGVEVRVVDTDLAGKGVVADVATGEQGEIVIRGPNLFTGYWNDPRATQAALIDGYLRSGDLAVRESDNQIRIVGRTSVDIIKSRGFKIGAGEIEDVLLRHPQVAEAAAVGLPDSDLGELVVAAVIPRTGCNPSGEELREYARRYLARHKVPARIVCMAEFPRSGPGKIHKKNLIAALANIEK